VSPALFPNVVDRVPGWRSNLPVGSVAAVTALLVGSRGPHATISERSEQATVCS